MVPVLHIESHGGTAGLAASTAPDAEWLTWEELIDPLQELNLATRCNLVMLVAACIGFAAIQAFRQGSRAPVVALVGPDTEITPNKLFEGTKEFYRRWMDTPILIEITESASREMGTVNFELEPFASLCYEAMLRSLIKAVRPAEHQRRAQKLRMRLLAETTFTNSEIETRLAHLSPFPPWQDLQKIWDQMFMIDLCPANKKRFALDVRDILKRIEAFAGRKPT